MKKLLLSGLLCFLFFGAHAQYENDRTGYEGDYFSLEGALDVFRESSTLRNFERRLNSEDYYVNNLDLNYDGQIDYVRVEHRQQGNFHAIVLQAVVDRYEVQDVAVIELEVIGRREAVLQIIGDEDLYGREVIVEPRDGYADNRGRYHRDYGTYVNVFYWRPVQYILGRQYRTYVSPYRWRSYPTWWAPRIQLTWGIFRPRIVVYTNRFIVVTRHRVVRVHNFYRPYRTYCPTVLQRSNTVRVRQGRQPIYRGQGGQAGQPRNRNAGNGRNRGEVVQNPRQVDRANARREAPSSISRKRTQEAAGADNRRRGTAEASQRSRTYEAPTRTSRNSSPKKRSAEVQRPSRTYSQGQSRSRSASPQSKSSSRTRSSAARSSSRSASRSSAPQVRQPSRSKASSSSSSSRARSSTSSPSKARSSSGSRSRVAKPSPSRSRKSSASSSRTRSSSGSKSSSSRSKSSSSPSRSRKGRGQ